MIKTETTTINGREWQCTQFSGTKNFDILYSLAAVLGPSLARVLRARGGNILDADVDFGSMADTLFKGLGKPGDALNLIMRLLGNTHVDGKPMSTAVFDEVFAGPDIQTMIPVLSFVMRTNFGDFSQATELIIGASVAQEENLVRQ